MDRSKPKPVAKAESESNVDEVMAIFGDESLVSAVTRVADGIEEHSAMLAAVQQKMDGKILWVIDSGVTDHVCKDRSAFYSIKRCATPMRYRTAGNDVVSEEEGMVAMQLPESKKLVLQHLTYLLSAPANLLSLGTLQKKGWTFDFAGGYMSLGSHRIRMYNVGPKGKQQKGKLHAICLQLVVPAPVVEQPVSRTVLVVTQEKDSLANWHRRLAHNGASTIKELAATGRLQIFKFFQAMTERAFDRKIRVVRTEGGNEDKDVMGQYLRHQALCSRSLRLIRPS
jgi:hypothetical protein